MGKNPIGSCPFTLGGLKTVPCDGARAPAENKDSVAGTTGVDF